MEGRCGTFNSIRVAKTQWIKEKLIRPLIIMSEIDDPDFPGVPKVSDLLKTEEDKQAFEFFSTPDEIQDPIMLPPGTPKDILDVYRKAFEATARDPEYLAEALQRQQNIVPR